MLESFSEEARVAVEKNNGETRQGTRDTKGLSALSGNAPAAAVYLVVLWRLIWCHSDRRLLVLEWQRNVLNEVEKRFICRGEDDLDE